MEKNSAPRFPRLALSRLMCPTSSGFVEPMSKFSSRKRCGVSAWVSTIRAESWIARALALMGVSGALAGLAGTCAEAREAASRRSRDIFESVIVEGSPEWRASPRLYRHDCPNRKGAKKIGLAQSGERPLDAGFEQLIGIDHSLGYGNRFESCLHFKIESVITIASGMLSQS